MSAIKPIVADEELRDPFETAFFKACNDRLQRQDDSISRGEKVVRGIVKWNKKNKKDGGEEGVIDRQDVAAWLLRKFSNTPAILMSFHEVAVSM